MFWSRTVQDANDFEHCPSYLRPSKSNRRPDLGAVENHSLRKWHTSRVCADEHYNFHSPLQVLSSDIEVVSIMAPALPRPTTIEHNASYVTATFHPEPSRFNGPSPSTSTSTPTTKLDHETPQTINIGTRKSYLARVQTDLVVAELRKLYPQHTYTVHAISTMGDKNQVTALHDFGAKSLWTYELEAMLVNGEVDFIVHCLKGLCPNHQPLTDISFVLI